MTHSIITTDMRKVLVFGGNGFLGGETVVQLLTLNQFEITVVNRGHWDNFDARTRIQPFVKTIRLDRKKSDAVERLRDRIGDQRFDIVIDFSAYNSDVITDALEVLQDRIKIYVYISTDSVYEVCQTSVHELSQETDSIRPTDRDEYDRLKHKDSYGHKKLKAEEALIEWQKKSEGKFSYIILRLPDVIGPRDSTDRWWFYQMWVQFYAAHQKPLEYSSHLRSSYVYVNDVAHYITKILQSSDTFHNEILNIGCEEIISVSELFTMIIDELNLESLQIPIRYNPNSDADFFPSVTRGGVNITKAMSEPFQWRPTPIRQVIRETIRWYNDAYGTYPDARADIVKRLRRNLLKDDQTAYGKFLLAVDQFSTQVKIKRKQEYDENHRGDGPIKHSKVQDS